MLLARPATRSSRLLITATVGVLAMVAGAAWLPFLHAPLTSDEGGYLYVARHWHPGTSLYGDHWVDRPPLLLGLFALAGHLGSAIGTPTAAVKLLGAGATAVSVALSGALSATVGARVTPGRRWPILIATAVAAALLASPMLGMPETDGELLALPFALGAILAVVISLDLGVHGRRTTTRALVVTAVAGALAMAAALVKQNIIDGAVFGVVALTLARLGRRRRLARLAAFAAGGAALLGVVLAGAAELGTSPIGLWNAVVVFRLRAAAAIATSHSHTTSGRLDHLLRAFLGSGAAPVLVVGAGVAVAAAYRRRGRPRPVFWAGAATTAWELVGAAGGGSYWLHYLVALIPGVVLWLSQAGELSGRGARWMVALCLTWCVVASGTAWHHRLLDRPSIGNDAAVIAYLRAHARPGDGIVVGFGHADIVQGSGLTSPYPNLWSLPVRVRDPRLAQLDAVLEGRRPPRWVVVEGASLATWGVDASVAQADLQRHYVEQRTYGVWRVWRREGGSR